MENYVTLSLETHLFFARIMKEHGLFLEVGFPCVNTNWIQKASSFREQFEDLLRNVVELSDGRVNAPILQSNELVTEFTIPAERRTEGLSGVTYRTSVGELMSNRRPSYKNLRTTEEFWNQIMMEHE